MNEADRETAERHRAIWEEFLRRPAVSVWTGRVPLPPAVIATVGFVIPVDDAAVSGRLQAALARLEPAGCLAPLPPGYWHITVVPPALISSGDPSPPRLLPPSFIEQALEKGRKVVRELPPVEVSVRGINAFRDVLVAESYEGGRSRELACALRSALPELPERYREGHEPLPHVSLAQYSRDDRLEELAELIEGERGTDFGSFRAERLQMFVLSWQEGVPGHVEKHDVALGGAP